MTPMPDGIDHDQVQSDLLKVGSGAPSPIANTTANGEELSHLADRWLAVVDDLRPFDALVPVPLHPSRYRQRGFNQSLLLAQHVCEALGIAAADILIRTRRTDAQVDLGAVQRVANVARSYCGEAGKPTRRVRSSS